MIPAILTLTRASQGAKQIGKYLLDKYGEDYFALLIDEGGEHPSNNYIPILYADEKAPGGYVEQFGTVFATPGIAEKGKSESSPP